MEIRERCYWIRARSGDARKLTGKNIATLAAEVEMFLNPIGDGAQVEIEDWNSDSAADDKTVVKMRVLAGIISDVVVDSSVRLSVCAFDLEAERIEE